MPIFFGWPAKAHVCSAARRCVCGRRVGVLDEEHLDPFGDDDADLRSAFEWTLPRLDWWVVSASKRFKDEGVWYEALDPAVNIAVRRYWEVRMTRKVRHHTVEGVVEGMYGEQTDNFRALRAALSRLLGNMGVKVVADFRELEVVDTPEKRDAFYAMLKNKDEFIATNNVHLWLSDLEAELLQPEMSAIAAMWHDTVDGLLASEATLRFLYRPQVAG